VVRPAQYKTTTNTSGITQPEHLFVGRCKQKQITMMIISMMIHGFFNLVLRAYMSKEMYLDLAVTKEQKNNTRQG
jgi:hypothetical protein